MMFSRISISKQIEDLNIDEKDKYSNYKNFALRPKITILRMKKTKKYFKLPKNTWKKDIKHLLK